MRRRRETAQFIDVNHTGVLQAGDTSVTQYTWDADSRLVTVTTSATFGGTPTQTVVYLYDAEGRWIGESIENGSGVVTHETRFVYDGNQIVLQFDCSPLPPGEGQGEGSSGNTGSVTTMTAADLSHRYLWGPAVDQLLSDEQVTSVSQPGKVVLPLTDNVGTVRDLAICDLTTGTTSVVNHLTYNSFGQLLSQTNPATGNAAAVDCLFGFTGLPFDQASGTYRTLNRPYDPATGRWIEPDPTGFKAGDTNLYRYCGNSPANATDPRGESELGQLLRRALKAGSERAIKEATRKEIEKIWYKTITDLLKEAGLSELKQAHHIIVQALFNNPAMAKFLEKIGILKDASKNIVVLFTKKAAEKGIEVGEAALHQGMNIANYTKLVEEPLKAIKAEFEAGKLTAETARASVEKIQADIRKGLLDGTIKLQNYDTAANKQQWLKQAVTSIMALAIFSGMTEAQAQEVALANVERIVEQESYYRQKNVIVRYGQASYYTKDSNSKVARWAAFAADFFNPVDDVVAITDLMEDGVQALQSLPETPPNQKWDGAYGPKGLNLGGHRY